MGERRFETALVTGGASGIGWELARLFARDGADVALVGRNEGRLIEAAARLEYDFGVTAHAVVRDLSEPGAAACVANAVRERGLRIDALVNNAGFGYDAPFAQSDAARQRALVQTNDVALMELCLEFAPAMAKRGSGAILNVASIAGFMPGPFMATYYASKAFVQSFSLAIHEELAPFGVHVTALCPGPVGTNFWVAADAGHTALARLTLPASAVASAGYRALLRNKALCVPGALPKATVFASRLLPRVVLAKAAAALQKPR